MSRAATEKRPAVVTPEKMFNKPVPHSPDAEWSLIACAMSDSSLVPEMAKMVQPQDMWTGHNEALWTCVIKCHAEFGRVDEPLLVDMYQKLYQVSSSDAASEVAVCRMMNAVPVAWQHYAKVIVGHARARKLVEVATEAVYNVYTRPLEGEQTIADAFQQLSVIARGASERQAVALHAAAGQVVDQLVSGRPAMYATGNPALDSIADGIPKQGVVTCFGYPGGGKTTMVLSLAIRLAQGFADQDPVPVRVVSFEQSAMRIAATLLSARTGVGVHRLLNQGTVPSQSALDEVRTAAASFANVDFAMFEDNLDPNAIFMEVAVLATKHPRGVVVVDYLQDIPPFGQFVEQTPRITEAMRILARIARELGWLVIVVSQVDKAASRSNKQPELSDGLGSSAIEQRSDFVMYVWRPHEREVPPNAPPPTSTDAPSGFAAPLQFAADRAAWEHWAMRQRRATVGVIKNKFGPKGVRDIAFDLQAMTFREPTAEEIRHWSQ